MSPKFRAVVRLKTAPFVAFELYGKEGSRWHGQQKKKKNPKKKNQVISSNQVVVSVDIQSYEVLECVGHVVRLMSV